MAGNINLVREEINNGYAAGFQVVPFIAVDRNSLGQLTGGSPAEGRLQVGGYSEDKKIEVFGINVALEYIRKMIALFAKVDDRPTPLSQTFIEEYAVRSPLALVSSNRAGTEETSMPGTTVRMVGHFTRFKTTVQLNMPTIWSAEEGDKINEGIFKNLIQSMAVRIAQGHLRAVFTAFRNASFATQHTSLTGIMHRTSAATELIASVLNALGSPNITPKGGSVVLMPMIFKRLGNPKEMDNVYGDMITGLVERESESVQVQYYNERLLNEQILHAPAAAVVYPTNDPEKLDTYVIGAGNRKIPIAFNKLMSAGNEAKMIDCFYLALALTTPAMKTRASTILEARPEEIDDNRVADIKALLVRLTNGTRALAAAGNGIVNPAAAGIQAADFNTYAEMIAHILTTAGAAAAPAAIPHIPRPLENYIDPAGGLAAAGLPDLGTAAEEAQVTYRAWCLGFKLLILDPMVDAISALLIQGTFPGIAMVFQEQAFVTHPSVVLQGNAKMRLAWHAIQLGRKEDEIHQTDTRQIVSQVAVVPNTDGGLHHIPHSFISADHTFGRGMATVPKVHYKLVTEAFANADNDASIQLTGIIEAQMNAAGANYKRGDFIVLGMPYSPTTAALGARRNGIQIAEMFGPPAVFQIDDAAAAATTIFTRAVACFERITREKQEVMDDIDHYYYKTCQLLPICRGSEAIKFPEGTLLHTYNTQVVGEGRQTIDRIRGTMV
jgi:hypothetical protein